MANLILWKDLILWTPHPKTEGNMLPKWRHFQKGEEYLISKLKANVDLDQICLEHKTRRRKYSTSSIDIYYSFWFLRHKFSRERYSFFAALGQDSVFGLWRLKNKETSYRDNVFIYITFYIFGSNSIHTCTVWRIFNQFYHIRIYTSIDTKVKRGLNKLKTGENVVIPPVSGKSTMASIWTITIWFFDWV